MASRRTAIIGMLVIRQAFDGWQGKMSQRDIMASDSWAYGVKGIMVHHPLRRLWPFCLRLKMSSAPSLSSVRPVSFA